MAKKVKDADLPEFLAQITRKTGLMPFDFLDFKNRPWSIIYPMLKAAGVKPERVTPIMCHAAYRILSDESQKILDSWIENNNDPNRTVTMVSEGHPVLDPALNPLHPLACRAIEQKGGASASGPFQPTSGRPKRLEASDAKLHSRASVNIPKSKKTLSRSEAQADHKSRLDLTVARTGENVMKVKLSEVTPLLLAVGNPKAGDWNAARSTMKLQKFHEMFDETTPFVGVDGAEEKKLRKLLAAITAAQEKGDKVTVVDDTDDKPPKKGGKKDKEAPVKKKGVSKAAEQDEDDDEESEEEEESDDEEEEEEDEKPAKKKGAGNKAKASAGADRDKFGARKGSQVSKINAALGNKARSLQDIVEETKANKSAVSSHLRTLMTKGLVVKTPDGYKVKK